MAIQTHPKMLDEILDIVNSSTDVPTALRGAMLVPYFKNYMLLAVSDKWTTLDIDTVEFKNYGYHRSMAGALLLNRQSWKIVESILMMPSVKQTTKANQFKALSEMLYEGESKILSAILVKDLTTLYPNITHDILVEVINDIK